MLLPYTSDDIKDFYVYYYEWIDYLNMMANPYNVIENYSLYETALREKFLEHQWDENNPIQVIWIPPFVMNKIIVGGDSALFDKYGSLKIFDEHGIRSSSCTVGLFLFCVKNIKDGTVIILSPFKLNISSYLMAD